MFLKVLFMDQNILLCLIHVHDQSLSHVWLFTTPWTIVHQALLSTGFLGKNAEMGCHFFSPGDLPDPEIKPMSPTSPALQVHSSLLSHQGSPSCHDDEELCLQVILLHTKRHRWAKVGQTQTDEHWALLSPLFLFRRTCLPFYTIWSTREALAYLS